MNNLFFITLPASIIPSLLLLWFFYKRDEYPEPPHLIIKTFFLGVLATVGVLLMGIPLRGLLAQVQNPYLFSAAEALFGAAVPEESMKMLVIVLYCMRKKDFNEMMDGLVYGAAASLGFATLENVLYVNDGGLYSALIRALTAVPGHAAMGVMMGYYLAKARFGGDKKFYFFAWLVPVGFHAAYDFPLILQMALKNVGDLHPFLNFGLILGFVLILRIGLSAAINLFREVKSDQHEKRMEETAQGVEESLEGEEQ
ncbi:MAG: PrsW family intramembrane metalloprotease [Chitinispirillaceae bacterium]